MTAQRAGALCGGRPVGVRATTAGDALPRWLLRRFERPAAIRRPVSQRVTPDAEAVGRIASGGSSGQSVARHWGPTEWREWGAARRTARLRGRIVSCGEDVRLQGKCWSAGWLDVLDVQCAGIRWDVLDVLDLSERYQRSGGADWRPRVPCCPGTKRMSSRAELMSLSRRGQCNGMRRMKPETPPHHPRLRPRRQSCRRPAALRLASVGWPALGSRPARLEMWVADVFGRWAPSGGRPSAARRNEGCHPGARVY